MYFTDTDYLKDDFFKKLIQDPDKTIAPEFSTKQIQPASIDLRLSNDVWIQKKVRFGKIDVSKNGMFDFVASKYWKKITITEDKPLKLRANETVFGSIHEIIAIPETCCAKIEAKSGIARLSLSVVNSDYCNPGYKGHYPLQIHNSGKNTVILYPYMEICQLMLIELKSKVSTSYQDAVRKSIYANFDDGSPSKWWNSRTNKQLRKELCARHGTYSVDELLEKIDNSISERWKTSDSQNEYYKLCIYKRLDEFLSNKKGKKSQNIFEEFIREETRKHKFRSLFNNNILIKAIVALPTLVPSILILASSLRESLIPYVNEHWSWVIVIVIILLITALLFIGVWKLSEKFFSWLDDHLKSFLIEQKNLN